MTTGTIVAANEITAIINTIVAVVFCSVCAQCLQVCGSGRLFRSHGSRSAAAAACSAVSECRLTTRGVSSRGKHPYLRAQAQLGRRGGATSHYLLVRAAP